MRSATILPSSAALVRTSTSHYRRIRQVLGVGAALTRAASAVPVSGFLPDRGMERTLTLGARYFHDQQHEQHEQHDYE